MSTSNYQPTDEQIRITNFLLDHNEALVWAGMGTGKTAATLAAIAGEWTLGDARRVLILAPKRVAMLTWPEEIEKWMPWMTCVVWRGGPIPPDAGIVVTNYEQIPKLVKTVTPGHFDLVIYDEVTKLKNPSSKRFRAFRRHAAGARIRWGLTGTPLPNGHLDLWGQVRAVDGGRRFGPFWTWRNRWFESDYMGYNWAPRPGTPAALEGLIADMVLSCESPDWPMWEDDIEVTLPRHAEEVYRSMEREFLAEIDRGVVTAANAAVMVGKLRQITAGFLYTETGDGRGVELIHHVKRAAVERAAVQHPGPVLIASEFRAEQDRLVDTIPGAVHLTTELVGAWNAGEIPVAVAHPGSFGHGLNMQQGGHRVIWASPTWSRELYDQFNARLARRGQEERVHVSRVVCPGTIDDVVCAALEGKGRTQDRLMAALRRYRAASRT